ncbi:hypothetical protein ACFXAW_22010 [Streptomyces sp. NPDC059445]
MSKPSSAPQPERVRISNYCWTEHPGGGRHCCLPKGHAGQHWHPYSKTSF